jgi:hypothetical protein
MGDVRERLSVFRVRDGLATRPWPCSPNNVEHLRGEGSAQILAATVSARGHCADETLHGDAFRRRAGGWRAAHATGVVGGADLTQSTAHKTMGSPAPRTRHAGRAADQ